MVRINPQAAPKVSPNTKQGRGGKNVGGLDKLGPNDNVSRKNTKVRSSKK